MTLTGFGGRGLRAAITNLEQAVSEKPGAAYLWSDLAAAYLASFRMGTAADAVRALDAALRAVRSDLELPEARFNLALALETCSLAAPARRAWQDVQIVEPGSGWSREAAEHLRRLEEPTQLERWRQARPLLAAAALSGDALTVQRIAGEFPFRSRLYVEDDLLPGWAQALREKRTADVSQQLQAARLVARALAASSGEHMAEDSVAVVDRAAASPAKLAELGQAHSALAKGSAHCLDEKTADGQELLERSRRVFERYRSPEAQWARYQLAVCAYQRSEPKAAILQLDQLLRQPGIERYPSLVGRADWMIGLSHMRLAEPGPAQRPYEQALHVFEQTGAMPEVGGVLNLLAQSQSYLGEEDRAWEFLLRGLAINVAEEDPRRLYTGFDHAADLAAKLGCFEAALLFRHAVVRLSLDEPDPPGETHAFLRRAEVRLRLGQGPRAQADLARSKAACRRIVDPAEQRRREADILLLEGEAAAGPRIAVAVLTRALQLYQAAEYRYHLPGAYLARARAYLALQDEEAAEADLRSGIATFEDQRPEVKDEEERMAFFEQAEALFDSLIDLKARQPGGAAEAFATVERQRARVLLDRLAAAGAAAVPTLAPKSLDEVRRGLPPGVVLVEYSSLRDRLLLWIVRSDAESKMEVVAISAAALAQRTEDLDRRLEAGFSDGSLRPELEELYRTLLGPVRSRLRPGDILVVVPDKSLHRVPFAALRDPASGRYLVEDYASGVAPSASLYVAPEPAGSQAAVGSAPSLLGFSDPRFDPTRFNLPRLPGAVAEAQTLLRLAGGRGRVLQGEQATVEAFQREAPLSSMLLLATHTELNARHPHLSRFLLAPSAGDPGGFLDAATIQGLSFPRTRLVYLAACRGGRGKVGSEGNQSLARAFLAAGIREVVGSLWDVADERAGKVSQELFRQYLAGSDAVAALRQAQIEALYAEGGARLADWAPFAVYLALHGRATPAH